MVCLSSFQPRVTWTRSCSPAFTSESSVRGSTRAAAAFHAGDEQVGAGDQQAGRGALLQVLAFQLAQAPREANQHPRRVQIDAGFARDNGRFRFGLGIVEGKRDETLPRRGLQRLQHRLVARIIGNHEHEIVRRMKRFAGAVERQDAAVVGERMQHHGDVLARLDHFIEIANSAAPHGAGQRPVGPDRFIVLDEIAAGKVGRRQIVMTGDGVEREAHFRRHMGDEAGLAAACRSLEQDREAAPERRLEQFAFIALRLVEGKRRLAFAIRQYCCKAHVQLLHSAAAGWPIAEPCAWGARSSEPMNISAPTTVTAPAPKRMT